MLQGFKSEECQGKGVGVGFLEYQSKAGEQMLLLDEDKREEVGLTGRGR